MRWHQFCPYSIFSLYSIKSFKKLLVFLLGAGVSMRDTYRFMANPGGTFETTWHNLPFCWWVKTEALRSLSSGHTAWRGSIWDIQTQLLSPQLHVVGEGKSPCFPSKQLDLELDSRCVLGPLAVKQARLHWLPLCFGGWSLGLRCVYSGSVTAPNKHIW